MKIIDEIPASKTLEINAIATKLMNEGKDVINLTTGEPDFPTPERIKEKAKEALDKDFTKYTNSKGIFELRMTISKLLSKKGIEYTADEIIVTNGGKQAIYNALLAILDKDDEVILFSPLWVSYVPMILLAGAKPVIIRTTFEEGFLPNVNEIEKNITSKTKAILVNSPNNPTGVVYSESVIKGIAEIANKKGLYVIADEVYDSLVYDKPFVSLYNFVNPQQLIYINAFSKAYAMTGWRLGYCATKNRVIYNRISKIQGHTTSSVNSIAQFAAVEADKVDNKYMIDEFKKRRDFTVEEARKIGLEFVNPNGAFYLFFKSPLNDDETFCKKLLEEKLVALVPGSAFDAKGFVRLSFANSMKNLSGAFQRIKEFVK
ncbi:aspartate aminotransferase [Thermosipho atlanticus]|uniref:L-aspartate aminotransferase apoenzyme n=1 Tax=Thermosipho atlanticus DSM 15807 TaxID=1123380 RepID=A0A1M5TXH3_9BACT|nr:aspartate aminotransferase [Thermosipho atlanticus]SHH55083.1 L-aspartate aminotransferase apoenzyme [Thermosipho atlanticus DSM 15807]